MATLARPRSSLWRLPVIDGQAEASLARRIPLSTGTGSSPRFGVGHLFYVASSIGGDGIWRMEGDAASEVWSAPSARITGGLAVARDGRIAFSSRRNGQTSLHVANADGTAAHVVGSSLKTEGAPAWTPDARAFTVAVVTAGIPRLFNLPLDGGAPSPLAREYSLDPAWSPDGKIVAFSGPDVGTTFEVKALKADGSPYPLASLTH